MSGYLTMDGEWVDGPAPTGMSKLFKDKPEILSDDPDFAETVAEGFSKPVLFGLTQSELAQEALKSMKNINNWKAFANGVASYPRDLGWAGYGLAALSGAVGPDASDRVTKTQKKLINLGQSLRAEQPEFPSPVMKIQLLLMLYINFKITDGAYSSAGRFVGGVLTQQAVKIGIGRLTGGASDASFATKKAWLSWFFLSMYGAAVRLGEKHFDKFGNLDNLTPMHLITAFSGLDVNFGSVASLRYGMIGDLRDHARQLAYAYKEYWTRKYEYSFNIPKNVQENIRALDQMVSDLSGSFTSDEDVLQTITRCHNTALFLRNNGFDNGDNYMQSDYKEAINYFIRYGDPTILRYTRALVLAILAIITSPFTAPTGYLEEIMEIAQYEIKQTHKTNNENYRYGN